MCLSLHVRTDVSVQNLMKLARYVPVVKTPHVGNNSPNNLFAAKCGFPLIWVDSTIPKRDKNANPHLLIRNGEAFGLCDEPDLDRRLTTHARVTAAGFESDGFEPGQPLADGHLARMRDVFPKLDVATAQQHFERHRELTELVLEIGTNTLPHKWYRQVTQDGTLSAFGKEERTGIRRWSDIRDDVCLGSRRSGWVVPVFFAILHDIVRQSQESRTPEVWMLSGPDMIKYLPTLMSELRDAYNAITIKTGYFPEIGIQLVPFTSFRFTARSAQRDALDELFAMLIDGGASHGELAERALACRDIFTNTERRNHFSQHDMTCADDLYAPAPALELPLRTVEELWQEARSHLPRKLR